LISEEEKKIAGHRRCRPWLRGLHGLTRERGIRRTFELPWGQDALIESCREPTSTTIVIRHRRRRIGHATLAGRGRSGNVPALLQIYIRQEGGTARRDILFGKHNPEGSCRYVFTAVGDQRFGQVLLPRPGHQLHVLEPTIRPSDYDSSPRAVWRQAMRLSLRTTPASTVYPLRLRASATPPSLRNLQAAATADLGERCGQLDVNQAPAAYAERRLPTLRLRPVSKKHPIPERELKGLKKCGSLRRNKAALTLNLDARPHTEGTSGHGPGKFLIQASATGAEQRHCMPI